jgi:hypothetical protein
MQDSEDRYLGCGGMYESSPASNDSEIRGNTWRPKAEPAFMINGENDMQTKGHFYFPTGSCHEWLIKGQRCSGRFRVGRLQVCGQEGRGRTGEFGYEFVLHSTS